MKMKKCKICGTLFKPFSTTSRVCSVDCAIKHSIALKRTESAIERKKKRKEYNDAKLKLKSVTDYANESQVVFNRWVRLRDEKLPCISCQRHHTGQYHAGHYRSRGSSAHLRFSEDNCHKQCSSCNNHLSGNIVNYRKGLIEKIGIARVEELENSNEIKRWTIEELLEIKRVYNEKIKQILSKNNV